MSQRGKGAASQGGKTTARATTGGKTPKARSPAAEATAQERMPRTRSPAAEGRRRTSSDKKQKSKDESCHPEQGAAQSHKQSSQAGRKSSGGSGSGSGRREMIQDDPEASGLHVIISLDWGNGGTGFATEVKGPEGSVFPLLLSFFFFLLLLHLKSESVSNRNPFLLLVVVVLQ